MGDTDEQSFADWRRQEDEKERERLEIVLKFLWTLLDDIDTADDLARSNDVLYRTMVRGVHKERWAIPWTEEGEINLEAVASGYFEIPGSYLDRLKRETTPDPVAPGEIVAVHGGVPPGAAIVCDLCRGQVQALTLDEAKVIALDQGWVLQCSKDWPGIKGVENVCNVCKREIVDTGLYKSRPVQVAAHAVTGKLIQLLVCCRCGRSETLPIPCAEGSWAMSFDGPVCRDCESGQGRS